MSDVKQHILDLSTKMNEFVGKVENSTVKTNDDMYEKLLPEGVTMKEVKTISDYNTDFIAAATHNISQKAIEAMASDKSITEVSGSVKMGVNDSLNVGVDRQKTYTNHLQGGAETVKYGVVTAAYETRGSKGSGGQLKAVRAHINAIAAEQLK